ncbi:PspC domain-containing protein [Kribbella antibiotica]|uniref:PspC domain-containing protein n=1 Tax=Kribbella antibiotica TaxID=190195 RepID=A0A4V2YN23_9ACTN|nr:PspC domain-containing protein [Kribbella antibiotica]TDD52677.1 PspC domain-containing protein [Kribbella antibiotica]
MEQNSSGPGGFDRSRLQNVQNWQRSRSDRMVAGVCGGIGRSLGIDPVLIRVVMAVLIISGPGVIFYIAAWLLMPDERSDRSPAQGLLGDRVRPDHPWLGPIVVGVAVFAAIAMMSSFNFGHFVPGPLLVLAIIGVVAYQRKGGRRGRSNTQRQWSGPAGGWTHGQPGWTQAQSQAPVQDTPKPAPTAPAAAPRPQDRVSEPIQPVWTEPDPLGLYVDESPAAPPSTTRTAQPPAKGARGVKSIVVLLTGAAIGIAALAHATTATMLIIGVAVLGLGMLLGGFVGRTAGLLPLGLLLAAGAVASNLFPSVPRNFADVNYVAPAGQVIDATTSTYNFDAGTVHLDLTKAKFAPGAKVDVHGRAGDVVIKLPKDVDVTGQLSAELGEVVGLTTKQSGHDAQLTLKDLGVDQTAGPEQVVLNLDIKLGTIRVERG